MNNKEIHSNNIKKIIQKLKTRYNYYDNIIISCCFKKSKIFSYGISKPNIHLQNVPFSIHAEMNAINNFYSKYKHNIRKKIGNIDILIIRIKNNILSLSKPCQFCIKSLNKTHNLNKVYYTNNNRIYYDNIINMYNNINNYGFSSGDCRIHNYKL